MACPEEAHTLDLSNCSAHGPQAETAVSCRETGRTRTEAYAPLPV